MSTKASISISDQQDKFVRSLVDQGRYSSVSAVVQRGIELVREEAELKAAELEGLRSLLEQREGGEFVSLDEGRSATADMLAKKRIAHGL